MIRRHPYIFKTNDIHTGAQVENAVTAKQTWEDIKKDERQLAAGSNNTISMLDGISITLPAVMRANKLQKRAAQIGFDWNSIQQVFDKMYEEIDELKAELNSDVPNTDYIQDEIGDILFVATNIARVAGYDPETTLTLCNRKFDGRGDGIRFWC